MKKHFVTFFSPGTFVAEESTFPIDSWDVDWAIKKSMEVEERYGARPYSFQFSTRERGDDELDSHVVEKSKLFYLGGEVETLDQIKARNNPADRILISNMEGNGWDRIVRTKSPYSWTQPLLEGDTVLKLGEAGK